MAWENCRYIGNLKNLVRPGPHWAQCNSAHVSENQTFERLLEGMLWHWSSRSLNRDLSLSLSHYPGSIIDENGCGIIEIDRTCYCVGAWMKHWWPDVYRIAELGVNTPGPLFFSSIFWHLESSNRPLILCTLTELSKSTITTTLSALYVSTHICTKRKTSLNEKVGNAKL